MCEKELTPQNKDPYQGEFHSSAELEAYSITHTGLVREKNQDVCKIIIPPVENNSSVSEILAVADGMGGQKAGEVASSLSIKLLEDQFSQCLAGKKPIDCEPGDFLKHAIAKVNSEVHKMATLEEYQGMGTTLVVSAINSGKATIANVGDSRCYLYRNGCLQSITKDHSLVRFMIESGAITEEEAKTHPQRNVITRAIGLEEHVEIDIFSIDLLPGDTLLLSSDGMHGLVDPCKIAQILDSNDLQEAGDRLISASLDKGGHDNITVIVARIAQPKEESVHKENNVTKWFNRIKNIFS